MNQISPQIITGGNPPTAPVVAPQVARAELQKALQLLPLPKKAALQRAKPELVESESNPLWFVQMENYNYYKAAERLAEHWKEREALFGERASLPLLQTDTGALTTDDVLSLHTGTYSILPPAASGQDVLFIDRSRALANATPETKLRAAFYVLAHLARNPKSRNQGILVFSLLISPRVTPLNQDFTHRTYHLMNTFPIKIHLHLLHCLPKNGKHSLVQQVMTAGFAYASMHFGGFQVFTEKSAADMLARLVELGLQPANVPVSVGGAWPYENFTKWCREKATQEQAAGQLQILRGCETPVWPSVRDEDARRERVKILNVIHSRQKRERRKAEQRNLNQEHDKLRRENQVLKEENRKLEALLASAQQIVASVENGSLPTAISPLAEANNQKPPAVATAAAAPQPLPTNLANQSSLLATLQSLANHPPEVQALALLVLQQQYGQPAASPPQLPQPQPAAVTAAAAAPSVDNAALAQVLLASMGQLASNATQTQSPTMDMANLVQMLVTNPQQGKAPANVPPESLLTLVTLLLLQAQHQ